MNTFFINFTIQRSSSDDDESNRETAAARESAIESSDELDYVYPAKTASRKISQRYCKSTTTELIVRIVNVREKAHTDSAAVCAGTTFDEDCEKSSSLLRTAWGQESSPSLHTEHRQRRKLRYYDVPPRSDIVDDLVSRTTPSLLASVLIERQQLCRRQQRRNRQRSKSKDLGSGDGGDDTTTSIRFSTTQHSWPINGGAFSVNEAWCHAVTMTITCDDATVSHVGELSHRMRRHYERAIDAVSTATLCWIPHETVFESIHESYWSLSVKSLDTITSSVQDFTVIVRSDDIEPRCILHMEKSFTATLRAVMRNHVGGDDRKHCRGCCGRCDFVANSQTDPPPLGNPPSPSMSPQVLVSSSTTSASSSEDDDEVIASSRTAAAKISRNGRLR